MFDTTHDNPERHRTDDEMKKRLADYDAALQEALTAAKLVADRLTQVEAERDSYAQQAGALRRERDEARAERDAARMSWDEEHFAALSARRERDEARAQRDEFRQLGQQFERESRKTFDQSCANLARAEKAERERDEARQALDEARQALAVLNDERIRALNERDAIEREACEVADNAVDKATAEALMQQLRERAEAAERGCRTLRVELDEARAKAFKDAIKEAIEVAGSFKHAVSETSDDDLDRMALYSNGTVNRIIWALKAVGDRE